SSFRHYQTCVRGIVEIESDWTARERGWQLPEWMRDVPVTPPVDFGGTKVSFPGPQKRGTGGTLE
ncbi:MAG: hypothetical protein ABR860_17370, partial [Terracidiphilus sp.]